MKDFMEKCDFCGCKVIDSVDKFEFYSRTVYYKKLKKYKIWFYCPDCIRQFKIKTDSQNENAFYFSEL